MAHKTTIDYITTASTGDASDFGDLRTQTHMGSRDLGGANNLTYGTYFGGYKGSSGGATTNIEYVSIASTGNTQAWGELNTSGYECGGGSNESRGLRFGGNGPSNVIEYWAWSSTGDASDFCNLTGTAPSITHNAAASATRVVAAGGTSYRDEIEYITADTTGDASDFGDLIKGLYKLSACSDGTRSEFVGGIESAASYPGRISVDIIQYITVASTGNATDQGNLTDEIHGTQSGQGSA